MIKLTFILSEILNEASIEQLQQQFVDTNKILSKYFEIIKKATNNKGAYATWLVKNVVNKIIKTEDIYKYEEYFPIFEKYKKKYPYSDINQYKTLDDIQEFTNIATSILDNIVQSTGGNQNSNSSKSLVPFKGVEELKSVGISLLGLVEGYQCFKIPKELQGNENAWKIYRKWLAKCGNREEGEGIKICTMASQEAFDEYLERGPYYVFFNTNDSTSPYQFHYQSRQFMDKNDKALLKSDNINNNKIYNFFIFLQDKENQKTPDDVKKLSPDYKFKLEDFIKDGSIFLNNYKPNQPIVLPDNLKLSGTLSLNNSNVKYLPKGLEIGFYLNIVGTPITSLPKDIKAREISLSSSSFPLLAKITWQERKQMYPGIENWHFKNN
jgi:hypothetical protein